MNWNQIRVKYYLIILCYFFNPIQSAQVNRSAQLYDSNKFLDEIKNSQVLYYNKTIKYYDSLLSKKKTPKIFLEKCRFTENALYDPETEDNPKYNDWERFYEELLRSFPDNPDVNYYKLEHQYGDSAIETAKNLLKLLSSNKSDSLFISNVYRELAFAYSNKDSTNNAITTGITALNYNDTCKIHLMLARQYVTLGLREKARTIILKGQTLLEPWAKEQAAKILLDLRYPEDAVTLYSSLLSDTSIYINFSNMAKAYEEAGNFDSARIFHIKALENEYDSIQAAKRLFEFDLRNSPGKTAARSYEMMRKFGYRVDPFSFYRLRLFFKYPLYLPSWHILTGFLFILLAVATILILPYLWLLPLHYVGQWILRKKPVKNTLFSIRHLWIVSSGLLFSWFIATGFFKHDLLYGIISRNSASTTIDDTSNAMYLLTFSFLMLTLSCSLCIYTKRWTLFKPRVSFMKTIIIVFLSLVILVMVKKINTSFFPELIGQSARSISTGAIVVLIKSLLLTRGFFVTLLFVCIIVPIYEEFIFRGIGIESITRYFPFWAANLIQAAVFASLHDSIQLFPSFFAIGLLFGLIYKKSKSLFIPVILHSLNNLLSILAIVSIMKKHGLQ